jgi:predicted nucleotidyltransferase
MDAMNGSRQYELIVEKLRDLMPELRRRYSVRSLEVFGSFVRGEEQAGDGQAVGRRVE